MKQRTYSKTELEWLTKEFKRCFNYNPTTGEVRRNGSNKLTGSVGKKGYLQLSLNGTLYMATHVIWVIMTGQFPANTVDHKDRNKLNNKWDNLSDATMLRQSYNRPERANKTGLYGVTKVYNGKYQAKVTKAGQTIYLGSFDSPQEAHQTAITERNKILNEIHN